MAFVHDHDTIGQRHGFGLVVCDENRGRPRAAMYFFKKVLTETRSFASDWKRLVHQRQFGVDGQSPRDGDPLSLSARELSGVAVQIVHYVADLGRLAHLGFDLSFPVLRSLSGYAMFSATSCAATPRRTGKSWKDSADAAAGR
jgi:hypothetical protein